MLKKRIGLIIITLLLGTVVAGCFTFLLVTPQYKSAAELVVQAKENDNGNLQADMNANLLAINTYKDMILGNQVMKKVQDELAKDNGYQLAVAELKDRVEVTQAQNSQMFRIQATGPNPDEVMIIANKVAAVFQKNAADVLNVSKVTITSEAELPSQPFSPNHKLNIAIGAILGLMLGLGIAALLEVLDKTVKDERYITEELQLPLISSISEMGAKDLQKGLQATLIESQRAPKTNKKKQQSPMTRSTRARS